MSCKKKKKLVLIVSIIVISLLISSVFFLVKNSKKTETNEKKSVIIQQKIANYKKKNEEQLKVSEKKAKEELFEKTFDTEKPEDKKIFEEEILAPLLPEVKCFASQEQKNKNKEKLKNKEEGKEEEKLTDEKFTEIGTKVLVTFEKIIMENYQKETFSAFPKTLTEFWERYQEGENEIKKILIAGTTFRQDDDNEKVDWEFQNKLHDYSLEKFSQEENLPRFKKFIDEKLNPQLQTHLDKFQSAFDFSKGSTKANEWMKKYYILYLSTSDIKDFWFTLMKKKGKFASCEFKFRELGEFASHNCEKQTLVLISSFELKE